MLVHMSSAVCGTWVCVPSSLCSPLSWMLPWNPGGCNDVRGDIGGEVATAAVPLQQRFGCGFAAVATTAALLRQLCGGSVAAALLLQLCCCLCCRVYMPVLQGLHACAAGSSCLCCRVFMPVLQRQRLCCVGDFHVVCYC